MSVGTRVRRRIGGLVHRALGSTASRLEDVANKRFEHFPFGDHPLGDAAAYRRLWEAARVKDYPVVDAYERETGYAIDRTWFHDLALTTQVVVKQSDICYEHGRLLYSSLSSYVRGSGCTAVTILETGTARGFSALCMAKALHELKLSGIIITFDVIPHDVRMFWNCIADAEGPRSRAELLAGYYDLVEEHVIFHRGDTRRELPKLEIPRVHFAFLDGMHTYECVRREGEYLAGRQTKGDVIVFDDYTPGSFPGTVRAIDDICRTHGYTKRVITISHQKACVIAEKSSTGWRPGRKTSSNSQEEES